MLRPLAPELALLSLVTLLLAAPLIAGVYTVIQDTTRRETQLWFALLASLCWLAALLAIVGFGLLLL